MARAARTDARRAPRRRGRALSRQRVKSLVGIGQNWTPLDDDDGGVWTVRQVHRCDGLVVITGPGGASARITFTELGDQFAPAPDGGL